MRNFTLIFVLLFLILPFMSRAQFLEPELYKSIEIKQEDSKINIYYNELLNQYDIYFVQLDLNVSSQSTYLSGNASIYANATEDLDTFMLQLHNSMIVDSAFINGIKVNLSRENNRIQYIFEAPFEKGDPIKAIIYYHGIPDANGGGVTHNFDSRWNKDVTWTLSESFHAYEWCPCKQVLSDKIDSTYIFLTCDKNCMAGSNGLLTNVVDLPNNKRRYEWKSNYPINYYLLSYAVADYQDYSIYAKPEGTDSVLVQNFIYNSTSCLDYYKSDINKTTDFIELFSEKFGLYPFHKEKYGHCLTTLGGGMEHQTMTTLGNFGYTLVAHELAHMWFGDYVTCSTWQDIWINEGFASYLEYIALENLSSKSNAISWLNDAQSRALNEPKGSVYIPFEDAFSESRIFSYALSYKKGAAILHVLRHEINNDELFFSAIESYIEQYANGVATGDDFKAVMEQETELNLNAFFDQWYYGEGYPEFHVEYYQQNDTLFLNVEEQTSSSETSLFQLHVDYLLYTEQGDTTIRLYQDSNLQSFKIPISRKITNIAVDPNSWILKSTGTVKQKEIQGSDQLFTYAPNPVSAEITLTFSSDLNSLKKDVSIYDLKGRLMYTFKLSENKKTINISELANGLYFIKVISNGKTDSYKFLKQ